MDLETDTARPEIETVARCVQRLEPPDSLQHYEGVAFSTSGNILAVAAAGVDAVNLYRRRGGGQFDATPFRVIGGAGAGLVFPHDVAFAAWGGREVLAVAQRRGIVSLWDLDDASSKSEPAFEIRLPQSGSINSDAVTFAPPGNDWLGVCNFTDETVAFFRRVSVSPIGLRIEPDFVLTSANLQHPDGLGFSDCGSWLAVANHGNNTVSIFRRRSGPGGNMTVDREPVTVISDPTLLYPHSVAFFPGSDDLIVTNSGAPYVNIYAAEYSPSGRSWSQSPRLVIDFCPNEVFHSVNELNSMEGGAKGVAIHGNMLALSSPEIGIKIYSYPR